MIFFLIVGLILGATSVIFALQNVEMVTVTLLNLQIEASLSLVILLSMAVGVLICILFTLPEVVINHFRFRKLKNELLKYTRVTDTILGNDNTIKAVTVEKTEVTETHTIS